jgi:hypothetical protein
MKVHNLLLLPRLLTRNTKGKEPLIDYSQSHIMTNFEYFDILRRKEMEKKILKKIKAGKRKDKQYK